MGNFTLLLWSRLREYHFIVSDIFITRLEQEIEKQGFNYKSLSLAAGLGETTIRDIITKRAQNPRRDTLQKIAKTLGKPLSYFLSEDNSVMVPMMGTLGADHRVVPAKGVREHGKALEPGEFVEAPPEEGHRELQAIRVKGDAMLPFIQDGALVYYNGIVEGDCDKYLNELCVVKIKNGATLIRTLKPGSFYGRYTLMSYNAKMLQDVELEWCARVSFIKL